MKPLWAALALASVLVATPPTVTFAQVAPFHVMVNDGEVSLPVPAEVQGDVVLAPVAAVVQAFGATATWDAAGHALTVRGVSGATLRLVVGQTAVEAGDARWDLPVAPAVRGGTVIGPVAEVLRGLGAYVKVDPDAGTLNAVSQVTALTWRSEAGVLAVTVTATGPVHAATSVLHAPDRLVVDLQSAVIRLKTPNLPIGAGPVIGVRGAQFHVRPYVTRLVFDLSRPLAVHVATAPGVVTLSLGGTGAAAANAGATGVAPAGTPGATGSSSAAPPASGGAASSPGGAAQPPTGGRGGPAPSGGGTTGGQGGQGTPGPGGPPARPAPAAASPSVSAASPTSPSVPTSDSTAAPEPLAVPPLPEFADAPGAFHVQSVTYDASGGLVIHASQRFTYAVSQWAYPNRLAIDIAGGVFRDRRRDIEIGAGGIRNIVISQFSLRPNLTRVLVHLARAVPYVAVAADEGRALVVTFGGGPGTAAGPKRPSVIIDPGHGGDDPGAIGPTGLHEADVALSIGRMVRDALERKGTRTTLTRTDNSTVSLEDRPDLAQRNGGIVFVSIHANASTDRNVQGTTTYYATPQSQALAAIVQTELAQALGEPNRGVRTERFYVIVNTAMPAILVETAFISNPTEEAMLRDPGVQQRIAEALARGITKFLTEQSQTATH